MYQATKILREVQNMQRCLENMFKDYLSVNYLFLVTTFANTVYLFSKQHKSLTEITRLLASSRSDYD